MASKKAQFAGLFPSLSFRLQLSQFDAGYERITACAWTLGLQQGPPEDADRAAGKGETARWILFEISAREQVMINPTLTSEPLLSAVPTA